MKLRLTFRAKLLAVVAIEAVALLLVIVASGVLGQKAETELAVIQDRYLPRMLLEPELASAFERLQRAFQDAVAAHDREMLAATREIEGHFQEKLAAARGGALDPKAADMLAAAESDYYAAALDVSRRLISDETGEAIVDRMAAMQDKQAKLTLAIQTAAAFDRKQLSDAFTAAASAEREAQRYRLWISLACLALVLTISIVVIRSLGRSVGELKAGLSRFGAGRFDERIILTTGDELEDVAENANVMAGRVATATRELEAFCYSVAHDLRAPLRGINGFAQALVEDHAPSLDDDAKDFLERIRAGSERMGILIDALLALSRVSRTELVRQTVDLTRAANAVVQQLRQAAPDRQVEAKIQDGLVAEADPALVRAALDNLIGNAWKFTGSRPDATIEFTAEEKGGATVYCVKDNGAGFDMAYADKLCAPFQRLHSAKEFPGTGIGLATVQRIVLRHGGRIWAEGAVGEGARFYFTLGGEKGVVA